MASTSRFSFTEETTIQKNGKTNTKPERRRSRTYRTVRSRLLLGVYERSSPQPPTVPDLNSRSWMSEKTSRVRKNSTEMAAE